MPDTQPLFYGLKKSSVGATNEYLKSPRVPRGEVWHVTRVTFEDETTAYTSARIFRGTEQTPAWLSEQLASPAAVLFWDEGPFRLGEGEEIGVRFTGTTTLDQLTAVISGEREYLGKAGPQSA